MYNNDIFSRVRDYLDSLDVETLIAYHNHVESETAGDSYIYHVDDFGEVLDSFAPVVIAQMVYYGSFCPVHKFFWFNGYGNLDSSGFLPDVVFTSDLACYIVDEDDDMGDDEIREILDSATRYADGDEE